ncbi:hypothetical protein PsYK624_037930 [Phanerochaete sordida]|uniref:Uncharacterized protein n=1 Tax=Phanerochaete sordida TaxID=48140 RepID=A0A9P3G4I8_9APHY|nr:hypothetical protein PsYK624_037930 [Phanerochaete sordida]
MSTLATACMSLYTLVRSQSLPARVAALCATALNHKPCTPPGPALAPTDCHPPRTVSPDSRALPSHQTGLLAPVVPVGYSAQDGSSAKALRPHHANIPGCANPTSTRKPGSQLLQL